MTVSHDGRSQRGITRQRIGAWWYDDGRLGMTGGELSIDGVLVVSTIGSERRNRAIHLIEQGTDLGRVIELAGGQRRRCDLPGVSVHGDVQLSTRAPGLRAMLLEQPF